jgi:hypothetical protein
MNIPDNKPEQTFLERIRHRFIGMPRNINEPSLFHKISLIPLLAWIGLGADGLSSSSYGPEEAFKALGPHTYLAIFIAQRSRYLLLPTPIPESLNTFPTAAAGILSQPIPSATRLALLPGRLCLWTIS